MLEDVIFAAMIGALPTISMLGASLILFNAKVSPTVEACFQNFCAGLILAAVAAELFPLVTASVSTSNTASVFGVTVGFALGILMINGVERIIEMFENTDAAGQVIEIPQCEFSCKEFISARSINISPLGYESVAHDHNHNHNHNDAEKTSEMTHLSSSNDSPGIHMYGGVKIDLRDDGKGEWEFEPVKHSALAFATETHRSHMKEHFVEVLRAIEGVQRKFEDLVTESKAENVASAERISEEIDEEVHRLQYMLDHIRRLMEGSEARISSSVGITANIQHWWNDADRNERLDNALGSLKYMCDHLIDHIERPKITIPVIREMHQHIDDMEYQINSIHHITEEVSFKWRRATKSLPDPVIGSKVPASLVIPVTIDGFVDGFMIGIACAVSHKAGFILALANFLEMAFLGMAVSVRVRKCTGSSLSVRYASIIAPPIIMLLATVLGAASGSAAKAIPALFIAFVSFGIVALLFLVCNELLVEARKVQEEEGESWWIPAMVFLGVWVVIILGDLEDYLTIQPDVFFG